MLTLPPVTRRCMHTGSLPAVARISFRVRAGWGVRVCCCQPQGARTDSARLMGNASGLLGESWRTRSNRRSGKGREGEGDVEEERGGKWREREREGKSRVDPYRAW